MFNDWMLEKLKELNWSQADLARASGLTRGAISNYINGRTPDEAALRKIAKALRLPPESVFRAAGILPQISERDARIERIRGKIDQITDEDLKQEVESFIDFVGQKQTQRSHVTKTP